VEQVEQVQAPEKATTPPKKSAAAKKAKAPVKKNSPYDHLSVQQLEEMLIERETRMSALHERFGDPAVCKNPELLAELQDDANALAAEIAAIDEAWQARAETHG
jgi:hypothetical protein